MAIDLEDAFLCARRFVVELYRREGRDVGWREDQLERWREEQLLEAAFPIEERIAAVAVAPEPDPLLDPEVAAIVAARRQAREQREAIRQAIGEPSEEHRRWSELLGGKSF